MKHLNGASVTRNGLKEQCDGNTTSCGSQMYLVVVSERTE